MRRAPYAWGRNDGHAQQHRDRKRRKLRKKSSVQHPKEIPSFGAFSSPAPQSV